MTLQKVLSRVRQAVEDYHMIEEGDRIAVGISGGKDSLTLLLALNELRKFYPQKFSQKCRLPYLYFRFACLSNIISVLFPFM